MKNTIIERLQELFSYHIYEVFDRPNTDSIDAIDARDRISDINGLVARLGVIGLEIHPDMSDLHQDWEKRERNYKSEMWDSMYDFYDDL